MARTLPRGVGRRNGRGATNRFRSAPARPAGRRRARPTPCIASKIKSASGGESAGESSATFFTLPAAARSARGRIPGPPRCLLVKKLNPMRFFCSESACRLAMVAIQRFDRVKPDSAYAETPIRPSQKCRKRKNPAQGRVFARRKTDAVRPKATSPERRGARPSGRPCSCAARPSGRRA